MEVRYASVDREPGGEVVDINYEKLRADYDEMVRDRDAWRKRASCLRQQCEEWKYLALKQRRTDVEIRTGVEL